MIKKYHQVLIVGIVLLAAFLRLELSNYLEDDWDEDNYLIPGVEFRRALRDGDFERITNIEQNYEHPPLVKYLYGLTVDPKEINRISSELDQGGNLDHARNSLRNARLQSVMAGILAVGVVALINPYAGLALAIYSLHLYFSSVAYLDSLPVFLTALMSYLYHRPEKRNFWLSAVCFGAACACKYPYAIAGVALIAHALVYKLHPFKRLVLWGLLSLVIFYLLNPYIWTNPPARIQKQLQFHQDYSENRENHPLNPLGQLGTPRKHMRPSKVDYLFPFVTDPILWGLAMIGTVILLRQKSYYGWWFVLGMIFLAFWKTQWIQHNLIVVVPFAICAGTAAEWLFRAGIRIGEKLKPVRL